MPTIPQKDAGCLIEPPVSVPIAPITRSAATQAAGIYEPQIQELKSILEAADVDDEGQLGADEASRLLDAAGIKGLKEPVSYTHLTLPTKA